MTYDLETLIKKIVDLIPNDMLLLKKECKDLYKNLESILEIKIHWDLSYVDDYYILPKNMSLSIHVKDILKYIICNILIKIIKKNMKKSKNAHLKFYIY